MVDRSWFFASQGQQQGPYPEAQLHQFIASGRVTAETLVWTEGMADWQKAREIPGLMTGAFGPRAVAQSGAPAFSGDATGSLSIDLPLWAFLGRIWLLALSRRRPPTISIFVAYSICRIINETLQQPGVETLTH